ncbi:MAG: pseudouridine synthase [Candidatus Absconditabacteria bacterium]
MIRLDKYLANLGLVSRRLADRVVKSGAVLVNGQEIKKSDFKLAWGDIITYEGKTIEVCEYIYVLLYKSAGYLSSDEDEDGYLSYRHQMIDCPYVHLLHVAGRLDQDTEGLLLLSNDGQFIHKVISPKWEKEKEYEVHLESAISGDDCQKLEMGVTLDDGYFTLPAKVVKLDDKKILLTITEGKFHQVKRMLESVGNKVVYLKRIRIGDWTLDGLEKGEWKMINPL